MIVVLFACTLFLSSTLLFLVQPMVAKTVLPLLGGTPAVWNTCMVFFQTTLLAGYLYAHVTARWLTPKRQAWLHVALLSASLFALPIALGANNDPPPGLPFLWLMRVLILMIGVPFFVASTTGPLLQRWFARTDHRLAGDPYFLSIAGNVGSMVALVAYPLLVEPTLRLGDQRWLWTMAYGAFVASTALCCVLASRTSRATVETRPTLSDDLDWGRRLRWVGLAFVPSSLMLGVTTFITTDIAAVPLFWILPLAIYLLTFVLVFSRRNIVPHSLMLRALPYCALIVVALSLFADSLPPIAQGPIHLITFFVATMVCHGELARSRPASSQLTDFYLSMSVGGMLGGLFNALIAPIAFTSVVEYPIAIILACAARPRASADDAPRSRRFDIGAPLALGLLMLGLQAAFSGHQPGEPLVIVALYVVPSVICFSFSRRPKRFALGLAALMMATSVYVSAHEQTPYRGRSFFGVHRVRDDNDRHLRMLIHGRTVHGAQSLDPARAQEPTAYYHRSGPVGQAFATFRGPFAKSRIGVVGLGIGSLAVYGEQGQHWTYYEIDPAIARLALDRRYFTFLSESRATVGIVLGDARISLAREPSSMFDLFVVDAFSSDAIPVHLLTREALHLYMQHLDAHGVIAFHISNRFMQLEPLIAELTRNAGLIARVQIDYNVTPEQLHAGKIPSQWVFAARSAGDLGALAGDSRWRPLDRTPRSSVWTDDFSNPLALFRW